MKGDRLSWKRDASLYIRVAFAVCAAVYYRLCERAERLERPAQVSLDFNGLSLDSAGPKQQSASEFFTLSACL